MNMKFDVNKFYSTSVWGEAPEPAFGFVRSWVKKF